MDTGNKTLAQLAAEHNEIKYVTLEVASKLSGYTKDYIERLCRLGKIDYRMLNEKTVVPELESLLKQTHTILVSYEGLTFVNKEETRPPLIDSAKQAAPVSEPPGNIHLVATDLGHEERKELFEYIGRSVISSVTAGPEKEHTSRTRKPEGENQIIPSVSVASVIEKSENIAVEDALPVVPALSATALATEPHKSAIHLKIEDLDPEDPVLTAAPVSILSPFPIAGGNIHKINVINEDESQEVVPPPILAQKVLPQATPVTQKIAVVDEDQQLGANENKPKEEPSRVRIAISEDEFPGITHQNTAAALPSSAQMSVPSPVVVPRQELPMIMNAQFLMNIDPHPLTRSVSFQLMAVSAMLLFTALIGWATVNGEGGKGALAADRPLTEKEQLAGVANSFSDDVEITKNTHDNSLTVEPVFPDGSKGQGRKFMLIPVIK